jgi:hypothetical protein
MLYEITKLEIVRVCIYARPVFPDSSGGHGAGQIVRDDLLSVYSSAVGKMDGSTGWSSASRASAQVRVARREDKALQRRDACLHLSVCVLPRRGG